MNAEILSIANAMVRKPCLPNFHRGLQFLLHSEGKSAFDELNRSLEGHARSEKDVKMIGHQYIFVEMIGAAPIGLESFQKQFSPALIAKESAPLPGLRGDKVCLPCTGLLSSRSQL